MSCLLTGAVVGHVGYNTFIHTIKNFYLLFLVDILSILSRLSTNFSDIGEITL